MPLIGKAMKIPSAGKRASPGRCFASRCPSEKSSDRQKRAGNSDDVTRAAWSSAPEPEEQREVESAGLTEKVLRNPQFTSRIHSSVRSYSESTASTLGR